MTTCCHYGEWDCRRVQDRVGRGGNLPRIGDPKLIHYWLSGWRCYFEENILELSSDVQDSKPLEKTGNTFVIFCVWFLACKASSIRAEGWRVSLLCLLGPLGCEPQEAAPPFWRGAEPWRVLDVWRQWHSAISVRSRNMHENTQQPTAGYAKILRLLWCIRCGSPFFYVFVYAKL